MKLFVRMLMVICAGSALIAVAADIRPIAGGRGFVAIDVEPEPPRMAQVENLDLKRKRNYPMQPPTIPHKIDGYQVDLRFNRCMECHSRKATNTSQAPMVSVTHYMDREGNFLAEISPRRFFCNQCHVTQTSAKPLVESGFQDMDSLLPQLPK